MNTSDFLIIGSGIAGLSLALKLARQLPQAKIAIVTKNAENESNTSYAQGGIAAVWDLKKDSFQKHINDTLKAGDGLCNREIVEIVVQEGPDRLKEIINLGADFDKNISGNFELGREGGHTEDRILHHKDITGFEVERALLTSVYQCPNICLFTYHFAIDLITQHHLGKKIVKPHPGISCYGAYVMDLNTHNILPFISKVTVIAAGGAGQIYQSTTNPLIATGDGIAMAYRAKAKIKDVEFIQFHPTALYNPGESPAFLISEAVRGFGGTLKTPDGKSFMENYDIRGSLASRDIVSRAIDYEMKKRGEDYMCLDCRHLKVKLFRKKFPNIYNKCKSLGIDITKDMIPVVPAAHYICGGIEVDNVGKTSINNLFSCGESSCTGLHGGNRLASNSLLEALVFSHRIYLNLLSAWKDIKIIQNISKWNAEGTSVPKELVLITHNRRELQSLMSDYVGIVRSDKRLLKAKRRLEMLYEETEELYKTAILSPQLCELRNLITVSYLVVTHSLIRKENKGAYFNIDINN